MIAASQPPGSDLSQAGESPQPGALSTPLFVMPGNQALRDALGAFSPNRVISKAATRIIVALEVAILLAIWTTSSYPFLPKPAAVFHAFIQLWSHEGLGQELVVSFMLNVQAIGLSTLISLGLAYSSVVPALRPMVLAVC